MKQKTRSAFAEMIIEGLQKGIRFAKGEIQLKTDELEIPDEPTPDSSAFTQNHKNLNSSLPVLDHAMNFTPAMVNKWESGKARSSGPAVRLLHLYRKEPRLLSHTISATLNSSSQGTEKAVKDRKPVSGVRRYTKAKFTFVAVLLFV